MRRFQLLLPSRRTGQRVQQEARQGILTIQVPSHLPRQCLNKRRARRRNLRRSCKCNSVFRGWSSSFCEQQCFVYLKNFEIKCSIHQFFEVSFSWKLAWSILTKKVQFVSKSKIHMRSFLRSCVDIKKSSIPRESRASLYIILQYYKCSRQKLRGIKNHTHNHVSTRDEL